VSPLRSSFSFSKVASGVLHGPYLQSPGKFSSRSRVFFWLPTQEFLVGAPFISSSSLRRCFFLGLPLPPQKPSGFSSKTPVNSPFLWKFFGITLLQASRTIPLTLSVCRLIPRAKWPPLFSHFFFPTGNFNHFSLVGS